MARRFTIKKRIDSVRNYYSSRNNASEAARKADEKPPHASTVRRLIRKLEESESVADEARSGRPSVSKSEDFQRVVLQEIDSNTPTSTRRIAISISVASDYDVTVFNTLKELSYKPYIPPLLDALNELLANACLQSEVNAYGNYGNRVKEKILKLSVLKVKYDELAFYVKSLI